MVPHGSTTSDVQSKNMIRHFYNKYSDTQKVSFWVVVSNIVLVVFTFGFGVLIQDSMLRSNQKINTAIARYDYGSRVFPIVKSIYSTSGNKILFEFEKWDNINDREEQIDSLYNIYINNKEIYSTFCDTLVHAMGTMRYYFPDYEQEIAFNNTKILMINNLLKYFDSLKNRRQDTDSINLVLLRDINEDPELWIYGIGPDLELNNMMNKLLSSADQEVENSRSLEDSTLIRIPELYKPLVDFNNQGIVNGEKYLILNLNKAVFENIKMLNEISHPEIKDSWSDFREFFTWHWLVFGFAIIFSIGCSIVFVVKIFPRRINRNHTTEEYKNLEEIIHRQTQILQHYEFILSQKKSSEKKGNSEAQG